MILTINNATYNFFKNLYLYVKKTLPAVSKFQMSEVVGAERLSTIMNWPRKLMSSWTTSEETLSWIIMSQTNLSLLIVMSVYSMLKHLTMQTKIESANTS